jgi:glycogen(starch) synthase
MRVLHVTWEYPPVIYGGLARHAENLARAQRQAGLDVTVLTAAEDLTDPARRIPTGVRERRGVRVLRARRPLPRRPWSDLLGAAGQLDDALATAGLAYLAEGPEVVHAHDWIGAPAARRIPTGVRERRGVRVLRARRPLPRRPWSDLLGAAGQLDDALATAGLAHLAEGPEVVHAHDWIGAPAARRIAEQAGARLVLTVHATEYGRRQGAIGPDVDGGRPAAVHACECAAVAAADALIVCSAAMRAEVCAMLGADPARVTVVPNAVDAAAWRRGPAAVRAARAHWAPDANEAPEPGGPLIAAAGRIEWDKGFSTIVRALPDLRRAHPRIRLVLAGRGSYTPTLSALAAELGVAALITLPGWLARRDLAALYAAADVVVVPSRYEPSGLVAREAQAAGATVISTRTGGLVEAVSDGETGLLIDVGDVHALRDTINLITADPGRGRRLAQAGATRASALTWSEVATQTSAVYAAGAAGAPRKRIALPAPDAMIAR